MTLRAVVLGGGRIMFLAFDVCRMLDVDRSVLRHLECDERETVAFYPTSPSESVQLIQLVSESGLIALLGCLYLTGEREAHKPSQGKLAGFRKWVARDVLPTLHRNYGALEVVATVEAA